MSCECGRVESVQFLCFMTMRRAFQWIIPVQPYYQTGQYKGSAGSGSHGACAYLVQRARAPPLFVSTISGLPSGRHIGFVQPPCESKWKKKCIYPTVATGRTHSPVQLDKKSIWMQKILQKKFLRKYASMTIFRITNQKSPKSKANVSTFLDFWP